MPRIRVDDVEPDNNSPLSKQEEVSVKPSEPKVASDVKVDAPVLGTNTAVGGVISGIKGLLDKDMFSKSGSSMFSAFSVCPTGVSFGEAEEGEEILLLLRAHIVTIIPWVAISLLLLIVPLVLLPLLSGVGGFGVGAGTGLVVILFWYAGTLTYAFLNFLYWYFNVYIVTNERIIDTDWYSVVIRKVSSTQISRIQDVSASQVGALAGLFDFGSVQIQTAGEEENFEFTNVPHPQLVAKQLNELMEKEEQEWEHNTV